MKKCFLVFLSAILFAFAPIRCVAVRPIIRSVSDGSMRIALTFDDGPHPKLTPKILAILEQYNVKATFFMVGENVRYYADTAKRVMLEGHEIGNHTYTHCHLQRLDADTLDEEIRKCEDALCEVCDYHPHLFRPPEGVTNEAVCSCAEQEDYAIILWSVDTRDWATHDTQSIVDEVMKHVTPGCIILMHDFVGQNSKTPEALEILLPKLLALGYEPVTVSELLGLC